MLTLLVGGARAGKSHLAERLAQPLAQRLAERTATRTAASHEQPVTYLATSPHIAGDVDLEERIAHHRAQRPASWRTVEAEVDLVTTLTDPDAGIVILDCLTLWVNNLLWREHSPTAIHDAARTAAEVAAARHAPTIVVTNEVGLGVHPEPELARTYRDALGRVNQVWAAAADRTLLVVAGRVLELQDPAVLLDLAPPSGRDDPGEVDA